MVRIYYGDTKPLKFVPLVEALYHGQNLRLVWRYEAIEG